MSNKLFRAEIFIVLASFLATDLHANEAPPATVHVAPVKQQMAGLTSISGTLISVNSAKVSARINGQLTYVAPVGSVVARGDVIARIDNQRFRLQHIQQTALISSLEHRTNFLSQERLRLSTLSKHQLAAATELESITSQFNESSARLLGQRASLQQIELNIGYLELVSPFDGTISKRYSYIGEAVDVATPVVQLVATDQVEVSAFIKVDQIKSIAIGQQVKLSSTLGTQTATISAIVPIADPKSHQVEIRLKPKISQWPVGLNIEVEIAIGSERSLLVHRDAIVLRQNSTRVFIIDQQNLAHEVNVTLGQGTGSYVSINGPVKSGDRAVIRGAERLSDQQKVEVIKTNAGLVSL